MSTRDKVLSCLQDLLDNAPLDFWGTGTESSARLEQKDWDRRVDSLRQAIDELTSSSTGECFTVYCSTGCSCCANENHERGPFLMREEADKACEHYRSITLLASQYARHGRYEVQTHTYERLPDGRLIIDGEKVCAKFITDPMEDPIYEGSYW